MKPLSILMCLIGLCCSLACSQQTDGPHWGIKANLELYQDISPFSGNTLTRTHLKPVLCWSKGESHAQEVEINRLLIDRESSGIGHFDQIEMLVRYQYTQYWLLPKHSLRPLIAVACIAGMERAESKPLVSNVFRSVETRLLARIALAPGFQWQVNNRYFLDFSLPLPIAELYWLKDREDSPILPTAESIIYTTGVEMAPVHRLSIRTGGGVWF